jgi:hypothetical protein
MKDIESKVAELPAQVVAEIIQSSWDKNAPDVMGFGLSVAHRIQEALRTALESASRLPAGWVAVPVEPTQEMVSVAIARGSAGDYNEGIWGAMLAARPEVPHDR